MAYWPLSMQLIVMNQHVNGLYIFTDKKLIPRENFVEIVEQAIRGGARVVQLREKQVNIKEIYELGGKLLEITSRYTIDSGINYFLGIVQQQNLQVYQALLLPF